MSKELIKYIENPALLNENTIFDLTLIAEKYPYFQTAQLLRVKNLFNLSPEAIKPVLNYTAAYVTDRKSLYYLLHPINAVETTPEKELIADSPVETEVVQPEQKSPEKEFKDTIRENISDALSNQLNYVQGNTDNAIEFSTTINVKKEYGKDVELDEYVVRLADDNQDTIELIKDEPKTALNKKEVDSQTKKTVSNSSLKDKETIRTDLDVMHLINARASNTVLTTDTEKLSPSQIKTNSIIDSFIKTNPKIKPVSSVNTKATDFSADSVKENDHLITDTLASIYLKQGNYAKAIFAYEKLSLKYPEKSTYFAAQITEIKKLIENSK